MYQIKVWRTEEPPPAGTKAAQPPSSSSPRLQPPGALPAPRRAAAAGERSRLQARAQPRASPPARARPLFSPVLGRWREGEMRRGGVGRQPHLRGVPAVRGAEDDGGEARGRPAQHPQRDQRAQQADPAHPGGDRGAEKPGLGTAPPHTPGGETGETLPLLPLPPAPRGLEPPRTPWTSPWQPHIGGGIDSLGVRDGGTWGMLGGHRGCWGGMGMMGGTGDDGARDGGT